VRLRLPLRDSRHEVCDEAGRHGVTRAADGNRAEVLGASTWNVVLDDRYSVRGSARDERVGEEDTHSVVIDIEDDPTAADPIDAVAVPRGIIVPC
jgi:hypothetical protein